jgi:hypothetical protein
MVAPKRSLFGVFRVVSDDLVIPAAALQLSRRSAESDLSILTKRNPETTYVVLEAHLREPKP